MALTMRRTKRTKNDTPWPKHWIVSQTFTFKKIVLESRKYEVALKGKPSVWYVFDRHVINPENGKQWIDGFCLKPYGSFTSFRPEAILKVRVCKSPKPRVVVPDEYLKQTALS